MKAARDLFLRLDSNGDGSIDQAELSSMMEALGHRLTDVELVEMMVSVDADNNGKIELREFSEWRASRIV